MNINFKDYKLILKITLVLICFVLGLAAAKIYQPDAASSEIYKQALNDYNSGDLQNAYFLFSKISMSSGLKPYAIYRQSICAKELSDTSSELQAYKNLFTRFPNNELSVEAKYNAARIIYDSDSETAMKYFQDVSKRTKDKNYKVAADYYISKLNLKNGKFTQEDISSLRNYLKTAPDGRLATDVSELWIENAPKISSKDYVLIANAYYHAKQFAKADEILSQADLKDRWALSAINAYASNSPSKAKYLVEIGVTQYPDSVDKKDYINAINIYNKIDPNGASELFKIATGKNKDYIWALKCRALPAASNSSCYQGLYDNFPAGKYAPEALAHLILNNVLNKNYNQAMKYGFTFRENYSDSEYAPMAVFWIGKAAQHIENTDSKQYFMYVIDNYSDTYYAYRSFWITNNITSAIARYNTSHKAVEFPYPYSVPRDIAKLKQVNDYELINKLSQDKFIQSWAKYMLSQYPSSIVEAQGAMAKLTTKPAKNDPRWKLVYPQNYYQSIDYYAKKFGNDANIITALIREESHFNPYAQSSVGALGLMQIMPQTAHEISSKNGYAVSPQDLFNTDINLRTGNMYFSSLKNFLGDKGISIVASYNAGAGAVLKWYDSIRYSDIDEFVEQIPYDETRNYVKKVFGSYWNYVRIYAN